MKNLIQVNSDGSTQALGDVAARLLQSDMSMGALRTNDVLRRDEWKHFDDVLVQIARKQLRGVADLFAAGLTYGVPNPLGKTRVEWERISDMSPAEISMSGVTPGQSDRVTFDNQVLPLPIIHKDFNLNIRNLHASRERGESLDTTQAELCMRKVAEEMEKMLFDGAALTANTASIKGYRTAQDRKTGTCQNWADSTTTGDQMVSDVLSMIDILQKAPNNMFGPYTLYIPLDYYLALQRDFKSNSDKTIMQRILEIDLVQAIRFSQWLPQASDANSNGEIVMAQLTRDVIDWVDGMQPALIQWDTHGGMVVNFKVMAIGVPRTKSTKEQQSGICHYSAT